MAPRRCNRVSAVALRHWSYSSVVIVARVAIGQFSATAIRQPSGVTIDRLVASRWQAKGMLVASSSRRADATTSSWTSGRTSGHEGAPAEPACGYLDHCLDAARGAITLNGKSIRAAPRTLMASIAPANRLRGVPVGWTQGREVHRHHLYERRADREPNVSPTATAAAAEILGAYRVQRSLDRWRNGRSTRRRTSGCRGRCSRLVRSRCRSVTWRAGRSARCADAGQQEFWSQLGRRVDSRARKQQKAERQPP